jgi:hypothetical protein
MLTKTEILVEEVLKGLQLILSGVEILIEGQNSTGRNWKFLETWSDKFRELLQKREDSSFGKRRTERYNSLFILVILER